MERRSPPPERRATPRGGRRAADHEGRPVALIVDDHGDSRELLAAILQDAGVTTTEAGNGRDALARMAEHPTPSVILIDLSLPDLHGTEVVRLLKADPRTAGIPIVGLSASVMAADKQGALDAGCVTFLEKPLMPDDVVALVRRLLRGAPT